MVILRHRIYQPKSRLCRLGLNAGASLSAIALLLWYLLPLTVSINTTELAAPPPSVLVLCRDNTVLHHQVREDHYRSEASPLSEIPERFIQATLAAEDKRFYQHAGVDILATFRSLRDSIQAKRFVSGASTITQQTVKLTSAAAPRNLKTKALEALQARRVEMSYGKPTILAAYLNHLEYGNLTQGPRQASLHYFGKELEQLSLAETALLAGLPQAPSRHNPRKNTNNALKRRNWVLDRMQIVYAIPPEQIARAKAEPIQLISRGARPHTPQLAQLVLPYRSLGRPTVTSTIDSSLQRDAQDILKNEIAKLRPHFVHHGALVIIDNHTREVLSLVGSVNPSSEKFGNKINAALAPRSPGSALKPFTYLLAFEKLGYSPATILPDVPTSYAGLRGPEEFVNYSRHHHGPVCIHQALGNSLNVPAVRLLNRLGGPEPLYSTLQNLGISSLRKEAQHYGLGLTLGSCEVTLLETCNAFATIARLGKHRPYKLARNQKLPLEKQFFSEQSTFLTASIMADNAARSAAFGSQSQLRLPFKCAVKTGTSSDFRDNFCVGFTADFTVAVWVGNLDNRPMKGISGITGAGPIFRQLMLRLHRDQPATWLSPPAHIQQVTFDPHTGKQLRPQHPRYHLALHTYADERKLPAAASVHDYDSDGNVYLDRQYDAWFDSQVGFVASHTRTQNSPLRVLSPTQEAHYLLDPDLPDKGAYLSLISNRPESTQWSSDTLEISTRHDAPALKLRPGKHRVIATDTVTKKHQTIRFSVQEL